MDAKPTARTDNLIIEELGDGIVVYDRDTGEAHSLDAHAASVWRAADGRRELSEIARVSNLEEPTVLAALDQLQAHGLLNGSGVSRRAMLRRSAKFGAAAVAAAPLVETVLIPTAAAHASTGVPTPPRGSLCLGHLTPDNLSAVFNVPNGLVGPGRYLVRQGATKTLAPNPFAVFAITTGPNTVTFTNQTTNGYGPAYHFLLMGTDGNGHTVNATVAGFQNLYSNIARGSLMNIAVYYVPGP